jgi:hypothetical protein
MNVGELLRERDRLLGVIQESKVAKQRLRQLNVLIAMYGDDDKVDLIANGDIPESAFCVLGDGELVKFRGLCQSHYTKLRNGQLTAKELALVPPGKTHAGPRTKKK